MALYHNMVADLGNWLSCFTSEVRIHGSYCPLSMPFTFLYPKENKRVSIAIIPYAVQPFVKVWHQNHILDYEMAIALL